MQARISELQAKVKDIAKEIPAGQTAMYGSSRENTLDVHTQGTFAGSLLAALGFKVPQADGGKDIYDIDLEHVLAMNPDWMFIAHYREESVGATAVEGADGHEEGSADQRGSGALGPFARADCSGPDGRAGEGRRGEEALRFARNMHQDSAFPPFHPSLS